MTRQPVRKPIAFDSTDAFQTFKDLLTRHKQLVAAFLQENYDDVRFGVRELEMSLVGTQHS